MDWSWTAIGKVRHLHFIALSNVKLIRFVDLMPLQYQQFALLSTWWPWSSVIWRVGQKYSLPSDPIVPNDPIRSVHQRAWSVERKICKTMQDGDFCPAMHLLKCCLNLLPPNLAILPTLPVFVQSKIQFLSFCTMPLADTKPQSYPERLRLLRYMSHPSRQKSNVCDTDSTRVFTELE